MTNTSEKNQASIISFSEVSIQATRCINIHGPSPRQGGRAARGGSVITEARGARRPPARTHAVGPGTGKSGATLRAQTPPRSRSRAPSKPHGVRPASVRGPRSRRRLEHPTAKALRAQPSAGRAPAARGGSVIMEPRGVRRPPARMHAVGPGTGRAGWTLRAQAPPRSRSRAPSKPHGVRPTSVRGTRSCRRLEHPTAKALRAQPSAGRPPAARWGSVITEPRGARRPPARTHAVGPGTGKSGADPTHSSPATLPL